MKTKFTYTTTNNLNQQIKNKLAAGLLAGCDIVSKDIIEELAFYCEVAPVTIRKIISGENDPSLPLALKVAEYFKQPITEIFFLVNQEKQE